MANVLNCEITVSKFELLLRHYVHFPTDTQGDVWTPLSPIQLRVK